jgi:hypothetical protein
MCKRAPLSTCSRHARSGNSAADRRQDRRGRQRFQAERDRAASVLGRSTRLIETAATDGQSIALARHGAMMGRGCRRSIADRDDRADAERRPGRFNAALAAGLSSAAKPARP